MILVQTDARINLVDEPSLDGHELPGRVRGVQGFVEWLSCQSAWYRSLGTEAGTFLAGEVEEIARRARFVEAETPTQYRDRCEVLEHDIEAAIAVKNVEAVAQAILPTWPQSGITLLRAAQAMKKSRR